MNLSDTHLVLLSAAAQRDDHLLTRPEDLSSKVVETLRARLVRLGAAEEVAVSPDQPLWFEDQGERVGLQITAAGLAAIGVDPQEGEEPGREPAARLAPAIRPGTKKAHVIDLLSREAGASLDDLVEATGWLPHTTRAALTGLRKAGHQLMKDKDAAGRTMYRLGTLQPAAE